MTGLVEHLLSVPPLAGYAIVTALVFGEAAVLLGFVLPGETAVLLGGVLASQGRLSLPVLLALVVGAAVVGDSVGYEVGRLVGPRLLAWGPLHRHADRLEGAQRFLRERGGRAVLLGRFTAFLRAVTPGLAGMSRMPYGRFLAFNALGGLVWGGGVVLLGYTAGSSYARVEKALGRGTAAVTAVLVVVAALVLLRRRHARAQQAPEAVG